MEHNPLKFWQFTDTHLYARQGKPEHFSAAILDKCIDLFLAEPDCDILLISGDLTCNGHADEHRALLPRLRRIKEAGKRVYVISATHDYGLNFIEECPDDGSNPLGRPGGKMYQSDLRGLYDEFGFQGNLAEYQRNSYVTQLTPGIRLMALNDDGDGRAFCGFYEEHLRWAEEQIKQARADGQILFGMCHHPTLPPSPIYPMVSARDMLGNHKETSSRLADAGLRVMFTGHTHMHNIASKTTAAGNTYWDINTASLANFPGLFREIVIDGKKMTISTKVVPKIMHNGETVQAIMERELDSYLRDLIEGAAHDYALFLEKCGGISLDRDNALKLKLPIQAAGKFVDAVTLGGLGRLLCCKIPPSVRKRSFKELFLELVRNIYAGQEQYGPETDIYKAVMALTGRVNQLFGKKLPPALQPLPAFAATLIYSPESDYEVEIEL
ncbi:MAG: metallophosphoesterase [Oscillospiraceae bacterium]|nr:metallophosphoesterase [Oscillospiraceae bacterium]